MRIAGGVVVDPVGDHAVCRDMTLDEIPDQRNVLLGRQLDWQGYGDILGELCVGPLLECLHLVPEGFGGPGDGTVSHHRPHPIRGIMRDHELLMQETLLASVVDRPCFPLEIHFRAVPVGRRQHGAAAGAAGDDAD
ncbi:hypothetical protein D3C80_1468990 [compost metagenome]